MNTTVTRIRDFLVSLKLTVVLLGFGLALVFIATLDQVNLGVWAVQAKYFRSFIVYSHVGNIPVPIFPGGYLIGGLLLINLVAAHVYRFGFTWRKSGIWLTHSGLILLLCGELLSGLWQKDYNMRLGVGETRNYAQSFRENELVIIDTTDPKTDRVVSIPEAMLARRQPLQTPALPFQVMPRAYYANSELRRKTDDSPGMSLATTGFGTSMVAVPLPVTYREDDTNSPSAFVELMASGRSLGTFLVSTQLLMPQEFSYGGRSWRIELRPQRMYYPFSLTLLKFSHDRYPGTDIPKNFSSRVRLRTADGRDDREVLIYMNNPLRYGGLTFYQAGFENNDQATILQVVRNPSWLLPYVACGLMTIGLVVQFGIQLVGFVGKRRRLASAPVIA